MRSSQTEKHVAQAPRRTPVTGPKALLSVGLIGILWGLNWPAVKTLLIEIEPLSIRAMAFPLAAIALAVIVKYRGQSLKIAPGEFLPIALTGLFLVFGFNMLTSLGQVLVQSSKAAIIAYLMPALTALLATIILGERMTARIALALALGVAGLFALALEDLQSIVAEPVGPAIMLSAALSWAIGNVLLKARIWRTDPLVMTVWFFALATTIAWPVVWFFENPSQTTIPSALTLAIMAYHIFGPMVLCYLMWTQALKTLPATTASIAVLTAPVTGVIASIVILGEPATWQKIAALGLILASIAATTRKA